MGDSFKIGGNLSVQMKLVADVQKKGEGAKVVAPTQQQQVKPRIDVKMDVETGGFDGKGGGTSRAASENIARQDNKTPVSVGAGKGVLGHLLSTKAAAVEVPDPEKLDHKQLRALLEPYFGQNVVVTSFDRDDAASLADAVGKHSLGDNAGKLVDVTAEGLVFERDKKKTDTLKTEFWQIARIKLEGGPVLAQDPAYPKHFVD